MSKVFVVDCCPDSLSKCNKCKKKIEKSKMRLGVTSAIGEEAKVAWRCLPCVTAEQVQDIEKTVGSLEKMKGMSDLNRDQKKEVMARLAVLRKTKEKENAPVVMATAGAKKLKIRPKVTRVHKRLQELQSHGRMKT